MLFEYMDDEEYWELMKEEFFRDGFEAGEEKGIEKGIEKGVEKGVKLAEGNPKDMVNMYKKLLVHQLDEETLEDVMGLHTPYYSFFFH